MSESKVYMFPESSNNLMSIIGPLLQQRGLDPNLLLMNGNGGFGGNWLIWILFLFILFRGNNQNGLASMLNNDAGRDLLMQAIQGNANAISQLATTLDCSVGQVQQAVNGVMTSVQQVGNQVGQSALQVINAVQQGNMQLAQQIASCCCENRLAISQQTNVLQQAINTVATGQERGFAQLGYTTEHQTCELRDAIRDNTAQVIAGQRAAEMRELQREITERDRKIAEQATVINNGQQSVLFGQMINQAVTPLATALSTLQGDMNGIKCKLPDTATIQYSPVVGIPTCMAAQYGLNPYSNGFWG